MKVIIIDNFDSFTFNLSHYVEEFVEEVNVLRYGIEILDLPANYDKIIISPGPGLPSDYPLLNQLILKYASRKPILGICLGLQAIAETFGSKLKNMKMVNHGIAKNTLLTSSQESLFENIPQKFLTGRYHSWIVDKETLGPELVVTAVDELNHIMALSHKFYNIKAVQFHPESILTPHGKQIIKNWIYA